MIKQLLVFVPLLLSAGEDFISHYEYGQMLYNSPRGVSCSQCHGESGEGCVIVKFKDKDGKENLIKGLDIRQKSLPEMIKSAESYHKIMPRYYLTNMEIKAIHDYLQKKNGSYLLEVKDSNSSE